MSYSPFFNDLMISAGFVAGYEAVVITGFNGDIDTGAMEDIWNQGGTLAWLSSAETMDLVSDDANDTSAGTGLQSVLVEGVDADYNEISEVVVMNGLTDVTTTSSFFYVKRLTGLGVGSNGKNIGNITATASTAATVQAKIDAGDGISKNGFYIVPAGKTLFSNSIIFTAGKISGGGGSPNLTIATEINPLGTSCTLQGPFDLDTSVTNEFIIPNGVSEAIPEKTRIRFCAATDVNNAFLGVGANAVLIDNTLL